MKFSKIFIFITFIFLSYSNLFSQGLEIRLVEIIDKLSSDTLFEIDCDFKGINLKVSDTTLIKEDLIEYFDLSNAEIKLNNYGLTIIDSLRVPTDGIPAAVTFNGKVLFYFWFWTGYSSLKPPRRFIYIDYLKDNTLEFEDVDLHKYNNYEELKNYLEIKHLTK